MQPASEPLRILIIAPDPVDARVIAAQLAAAHGAVFRWDHVDRLSSGLDRLEAGRFDAVLVDLILPDSHGVGAVERLRGRNANLPIVVLTGGQESELVREALGAGAEDFLSKANLRPDLLLRTIRYAMERAARRTIEAAFAERERRYQELLAAITSYTYSVKLENGIPISTEHSKSCLSVTGYSPEDYRWDPYLWFRMVHPDDRERVQKHVAAILRGEPVTAIEHRVVRRDGVMRWFRNTIVPHWDGKSLVRYDGLVEDVTERRLAEHALQEREMQLLLAQRIQERLLPAGPPELPGFDIGAGFYPAEFTAGDFFDYLSMPNGRLGFVVSDVSGHGFGASLLMASTSALFRSLSETLADVGEILGKVNRFLAKETDSHFVTAFLGCLDPDHRWFRYSSGGHPTGYVLDASNAVKARLESTAPPLAISPATEFPAAEPVALARGDIVVLLTDGILEAMSPADELFGTDRVLEIVRANRAKKASQIVECLHRAVCEFAQRKKPADDVTAIVIKVVA